MKKILLESRKNRFIFALIDDIDYPLVAGFNWYIKKDRNTSYAVTKFSDGSRIKMHQLICPTKDLKLKPDHVDGNGLNNQRNNLRLATDEQNQHNRKKVAKASSKYKGVIWSKQTQKWTASIRINKHLVHLGYFESEKEAAESYDRAAKIHFKEFANLNFQEIL